MRSIHLPTLAILVLTSTATAAPRSKSGSGSSGGALSRVSSGLGRATSSNSSSSSTTTTTTDHGAPDDDRDHRCLDHRSGAEVDCRHVDDGRAVYASAGGGAPAWLELDGNATVDLYAGAQMVHDSDGSFTLEMGVREGRLRVHGTFSHYFERLADGGRVTMNLPTLTGGIRIDDLGDTAVVIEGGVAHVGTDDPMTDSSLTGPLVGIAVEHRFSKRFAVLADGHEAWLQHGVRLRGGRVGVRVGYVQASFRVVDFNVGPPLFGPELGIRY